MARARAEVIDEARLVLQDLSARVDRAQGVTIDAGGARVGVVEALSGLLTQRVADVLQGQLHSANDPLEPRRALYAARQWARDRVGGLLDGLDRWRAPAAAGVVLAIPRSGHHLRDMLPVAELLGRERPLRWLMFRRDHAARVEQAGGAVALAAAFARPRRGERLVLRARLARALWPTDDVTRAVAREAHAQLEGVIVAARAIERAFAEARPSLCWIGNPLTFEGALARAIAAAQGVPTAVMQHGEIAANQREWAGFGFAGVTVWGEVTRDRLVALGVPAARVHVTGAPWVDRLVRAGARVPNTPRRVLVALSGPGNFVGLAEHRGQVEKLVRAAAALPELRWVFRLHPKDGPALYEEILAATPGARAELVPAAAAPDIHADLAASDLLVTVTSTSALDAMLQGVAVLTLARPAGEPVPSFVAAGATVHVPADAPLEPAIRGILGAAGPGLDAGHAARVRGCVERSFGPLDGHATERVAAVLRDLAR